jgi:hypothetical protein
MRGKACPQCILLRGGHVAAYYDAFSLQHQGLPLQLRPIDDDSPTQSEGLRYIGTTVPVSDITENHDPVPMQIIFSHLRPCIPEDTKALVPCLLGGIDIANPTDVGAPRIPSPDKMNSKVSLSGGTMSVGLCVGFGEAIGKPN